MIRKVKLASFSFPFCVATPIIMDHLSSCGYSGYNFFVATLGTLFYIRTAAYASKKNRLSSQNIGLNHLK